MNNSKLIHDYLDGKLKQPEQDILFAELANNADMRNEFNQQMKLHMIAQNDMALITPPAAATNAIFADLGFKIPPGSGSAGASGAGFGSALMLFIKKYLPNAATAIIAAVVTGFIIYWLLDFGQGNNLNMTSQQVPENKPVVTSEAGQYGPVQPVYIEQNGLTKADVQKIIDRAMANYMAKVDNYYKNYYAALMNMNKNNDNLNERNVQDNTLTEQPDNGFNFWEYFSSNTPEKPVENNLLVDMNNSNQENSVTINPRMTPKEIISNFNLSFRGFSTKSNVNVDVPSQSNPWFNNMSVGASYNLAKYHEVGLAVGQEAFSQEFTREIYGEELKYYQNPILFWYGATYRYSIKKIFIPNVLYPYVEVMGGFTKVGPTARAQIGLSYSPDKRVTFNLGLEGTGLWYNVQGNIYNTNKIGLTYGVSISY